MTLIHILDHQTDKILGDSSKFRRENHYESLNNEETFYFVEPDTSKIAPFLNKKNRVIIPVDDGFFRELIIDEVIQTNNEFEVFTKASYIELKNDEPIAPTILNGATVNTSMDHVLARSDWKRGITDYAGTLKVEFEEHINPYAALKKIASLFGLELRFRIETKNGIVTGRYVDMIERIGEWRGKEIVSGKDLINARRIEKNEAVVTALYVIGPQKEDGSHDVVKVRNEEARQVWGRKGKHLWDIYIPQTEDAEVTLERLTELGDQELNKRISAHVSYEIEGADIESVFGREHEKVRLGDNARVKATEYNPSIYLDSRIISREGPIRVKSQKRYVLGEFIEYTEDDIKKNIKFLEKQIAKKIGEAQLVEYAEKKIPELTSPPDPNEYPKYVDISGEVPQLMMWDGEKWTTVKGEKGDPGVGISGVTDYYLATSASSGVTRATPGWSTTIQTVTSAKKYLWKYEKISYTDGTEEYTLPIVIGTYGDTGDTGAPGKSIDTITNYYLATSANSGVTRNTTGWTTTMQSVTSSQKYLWNYEKITYKNPVSTEYIEPVIIGVYGDKGDKGDPGKGVQSFEEQYYLSTSATTQTGGSWQTTPPTWVNGKYMWTRSKITYTDGTSITTDPVNVTGAKGSTGSDGVGISSVDVEFYLSTSATSLSGGSWSTTAPAWVNGKYMWSRTKTVYTSGITEYTDAACITGAKGETGEDGVTTYTWRKYADDENGSGMSDSPDGKRYLGLAFNKTTPNESDNASDYLWSPLYDNVQVGGRNLSRKDLMGMYSGTTYENYLFTISSSGTSGFWLKEGMFEPYTEYVWSFKIKKISGNITALSGHSGGMTSSTVKVYRDGQLVSSGNWSSGLGVNDYPNDTNTHEYVIHFTTNGLTESDPKIYLQPNRSHYGTTYKAEVWDVQVEKGNIATDWTPAPEDTQAKIDEAKQAADNAQESADGKNTVFRQSSTPSTANRKIGDLWFDTGNGNRMHVWTGTWTLTKLDYQALAVGKLSAISADLGNVTAGHLKAVELEGVTGTFKDLLTIYEDNFVKQTVRFANGIGIYETYHKTDGTTDTIVVGANGIAHDSSGLGANNDFQIASKNNLIFSSQRGLDARFLDGIFTQKISGEIHQALSLLNSWSNYGSGTQSARAIKYPTKLVILEGVVRSGLVGNYTMATLPVGIRPASTLFFKVGTYNNGEAEVIIYSNGDIRINAASNTTWISLSGMSFHAA